MREAPPGEFDAWISGYVEDIRAVDRTIWPIHHRWNIINAVLDAGLLIINGGQMERPPEANSEIDSEEKASEFASEKGIESRPQANLVKNG